MGESRRERRLGSGGDAGAHREHETEGGATDLVGTFWVDGDGHVWQVVEVESDRVVVEGRSTRELAAVVEGRLVSDREFSGPIHHNPDADGEAEESYREFFPPER